MSRMIKKYKSCDVEIGKFCKRHQCIHKEVKNGHTDKKGKR